jgi:phosphate transport system substrate-binding protein
MKILTSRWAEKYAQLHPDCAIQCVGGGSENGIKALREGEIQICQSSRPLKPAELDEIAAKRGKRPVEFAVALDGLAVFVNEKNPLQEISLAELKSIYTGKLKRWGEITHPSH